MPVTELDNYYVGGEPLVALRAYDEDDAEKSPATVYFLGLDPNRITSGLAIRAGDASQFKATGLTSADGLFDRCPVKITISMVEYQTEILSHVSGASTHLFNIRPIEAAVATGATWRIMGYPLLAWQSGTVSTAKGSIQLLPSGTNTYTGYAGARRLVSEWDFTSHKHRHVCNHEILPAY